MMQARMLVILVTLASAAAALLVAPPAQAIYNGEPASWDENSQMVQVRKHSDGGRVSRCGGTLLDDVWVLTAAHCASELNNVYGCGNLFQETIERRDPCYIYSTGPMGLTFGATSAPASDMKVTIAGDEERSVAQVVVHPAYRTVIEGKSPGFWEALPCGWSCVRVDLDSVVWNSSDLALLRLSQAATGKRHSRLPSNATLVTAARQTQAFGWGDSDPERAVQTTFDNDALMKTRPQSLELTNPPTYPGCDPDSSPYADQAPPGFIICARSPSKNGGTGGGDSGGPLYAMDSDGAPTQIGVTSFGPGIGYPTADDPEEHANVSRMVKWIRSKTGVTGDVQSGSDNVATSLVIDNSGSMSSNDPDLRRRDASKSYVATGLDGDQIGAIGFESFATTIAPMTRLPAGRAGLSSALDSGIHAGGGTNIGSGLSAACTMLNDPTLPAKRAAILLTDGQGGYSNESGCFSTRGWKIFTVGLGSGVNQALLQQIADDTGGTYQQVPDAVNLQCEFQKIRAIIAGATQNPCLFDVVQAGQTVVHLVSVAARLAQIAFSSVWPGSDVQMTLISPSGRRITRETNDWDVTHELAPTSESYVIKVPEPGEWRVELFGADVDPAGEPVSFGANPLPFDNTLPELAPTATPASGSAPLTVSFDAHASDSDGNVEQVVWDFGDGTAGTGATTTHTYRSGGTYAASATAIDDHGEPATSSVAPVRVEGGPPTAAFVASVEAANVNVDASGSATPGATLSRYGWDFDGDGRLDLETTNPNATWSYPSAGQYRITLTIETSAGAYALASRTVTIETPAACPAGQTGIPPACVTPAPECPDGQIGSPPNCVTPPSVGCPGGQTGAPPLCTPIARARARTLRVTSSTTPRQDRTIPYTFVTRGKVVPAPYCTTGTATGCVQRPARRCSGRVTITVKRGLRTVSRRGVDLRTDCTYRSRRTFKTSVARGRLRVLVRFDGNSVMLPRSARSSIIRSGRTAGLRNRVLRAR